MAAGTAPVLARLVKEAVGEGLQQLFHLRYVNGGHAQPLGVAVKFAGVMAGENAQSGIILIMQQRLGY